MPAIKLRLFNLASALSLLLFLVTLVLYVRSYWLYDQINANSPAHDLNLSSGDGILVIMAGPIYRGPNEFPYPDRWHLQYRNYHMPAGNGLRKQIHSAPYRRYGWLGFAFNPNHLQPGPPVTFYSSYRFYFPHWSILVLLAPLPVLWLWRWRRRRTKLPGHCLACGYDLRGTALASPCPECGVYPPAPTKEQVIANGEVSNFEPRTSNSKL